MKAIVDQAANSFRATLTSGLTSDLGSTGSGPLAESISATLEQASQRATRAARTSLLATCDLSDPSCLDRRVSDLGERVARSFTDGLKRSIGIPALIASFVLGALTVLFLAALWVTGKRFWASRRAHRRPISAS